ncbi:MAG: hypothetical protein WD688_15120 [Candidatus Binatia bacterium]
MTYYLTGVPGVGKTTALAHFKNLGTWDEWLEERLPEMSKPFPTLTEEEEKKVDAWIMNQVGLKNRRLLDAEQDRGIGITLVDRCVPDAVSFTQPEGWSDKAKALLDAVSPGESNRAVHPGHVILLSGDPTEIMIRAATKNKVAPENYTNDIQEALCRVYGENGVTHLNVRNLSVGQVVKEIARIIHLGEYVECNLQGRLEEIRDEKITALKPIRVA